MQRILNHMKEVSQSADIKILPSPEEPPVYIPEKGGVELYTIDEGGELLTVEPKSDLAKQSVLIVCNNVIKRMFIMKLNDESPQRLMFLAGKTASNLNSNRFKNEFSIRNVSDPLEREMLLEKIGIIQKIST